VFEYWKLYLNIRDTRWRSWLRHCTTSRKVAGSILVIIIGIFHWRRASGRTMALGSTQPPTEMSKKLSNPVTGPVWPRGWAEVQLYSSMTSALEGGGWSAARPGRILPPGKTRCPLYWRLGGPQGRSGQARKISPPPVFDPRPSSP
jgi:hypothetical protein